MILQRDARLNENINRWGCYFMSLLFLANKWNGTLLGATEIERIYRYAVKLFWMRENCYIENPRAILGYCGLDTEFLGKRGPHYLCGERDIEVLQYRRGAQIHFVAGDGQGNVAYDPWGVSRSVTEGQLDSKRIFRRL